MKTGEVCHVLSRLRQERGWAGFSLSAIVLRRRERGFSLIRLVGLKFSGIKFPFITKLVKDSVFNSGGWPARVVMEILNLIKSGNRRMRDRAQQLLDHLLNMDEVKSAVGGYSYWTAAQSVANLASVLQNDYFGPKPTTSPAGQNNDVVTEDATAVEIASGFIIIEGVKMLAKLTHVSGQRDSDGSMINFIIGSIDVPNKNDVKGWPASPAPSLGEELEHHQDFQVKVPPKRKRPRRQCPECGVIMSSQAAVNRHLRAVHRENSEFNCLNCSAKFANRTTLTKHVSSNCCH